MLLEYGCKFEKGENVKLTMVIVISLMATTIGCVGNPDNSNGLAELQRERDQAAARLNGMIDRDSAVFSVDLDTLVERGTVSRNFHDIEEMACALPKYGIPPQLFAHLRYIAPGIIAGESEVLNVPLPFPAC